MEKNIKAGMFLNLDHTVTKEFDCASYAVVFDPQNRLAVQAVPFEPGDFASVEFYQRQAFEDGFDSVIPTDQDLLKLASVWQDVKSGLGSLGVKLPAGRVWTRSLHDDCSYFTVDLDKGCVHHAAPEEICDIILLARY